MVPPPIRLETALLQVLSAFIMIYILTTYFDISGFGLLIVGIPLAKLLSWGLEQIHDLLRYRRYGEYYVDRRTGEVWWRSWFAPNSWDAGVSWVRTSITESEIIDRLTEDTKDE